ncbi:MAG: hypothetical protein WDN06_21740 [Asticcacaulis sp.]
MASDGGDLAAAILTLKRIGAAEDFDAAVEDAFPGCHVGANQGVVVMWQKGLLRPLQARELSRRHLALPVADGGPVVAASAGPDDPQRTGDEPAPPTCWRHWAG